MTDLATALQKLYPHADFAKDVILQDDADGRGPYVAEWNLPGKPPTKAALARAGAA